jgi:hypothetical protein
MAVSQKEKGPLSHFRPAPRIRGWGSISAEDGVRRARHNAVNPGLASAAICAPWSPPLLGPSDGVPLLYFLVPLSYGRFPSEEG